VLHDFHNPDEIIRELSRVLKPDGVLTVIDHKLRDKEIKALIAKPSLSSRFKFQKKIDDQILVFKLQANI
jgi:ubiquinone/menaquinone biosynthesis C-methylase UbiE